MNDTDLAPTLSALYGSIVDDAQEGHTIRFTVSGKRLDTARMLPMTEVASGRTSDLTVTDIRAAFRTVRRPANYEWSITSYQRGEYGNRRYFIDRSTEPVRRLQ